VSDQDQLVQLIYDGVDDPCGLQHALVAIAAHMGATQGQIMTIENGTTLVENRFHGGPESAFSDYVANWMDKDPRFALSVQRQGVLLSDVADIDRALFERSAIYNELLRKSESNYTLFGNFGTARNTLMALAIMRGQHGGPFAPAEIVRLDALIPHLRRATRLRCLVGSMQAELDDLRRALDVHPSAIAILDATGNVVCANTAAEALFREPGGIGTERGMLAAAAPAARRALAAAIARAVKEADASVAQLATAPSTVPISRTARSRQGPDVSLGQPVRVTAAQRAARGRRANRTRARAVSRPAPAHPTGRSARRPGLRPHRDRGCARDCARTRADGRGLRQGARMYRADGA